jgi:hypothetical protein
VAVAVNSFVRIKGLPPAVRLTEGHFIRPGVWAVPLAALPDLTIALPAGIRGEYDVEVSLVGVDGTILAVHSDEVGRGFRAKAATHSD